MAYNHEKIEKKWQRTWEKLEIFKTKQNSSKPKFYCLDMFPYPSGDGLHVGHPRGYIATDIASHLYRRKGHNVLHPMGWDAFGLPAENYALKTKVRPRISIKKNVKTFTKQLKSLGFSYDWSREINTTDPEYYKWTQWMFLQLYKNGLAYRKEVPANFCPSCKTILANEQVVEGKCERCDTEVEQEKVEQWMFKITNYAESLLNDLDNLDWPDTTKAMQRNWIGRSEGTEINFSLGKENKLKVFTTRPDTLFGCTYLVIAPEHEIITELKSQILNLGQVKKYIKDSKKRSERERISETKIKTGVEIKGIKAINPVNNREIPIFVADYVLASYGTGAIMAVPAHDQRDFEFAKKYNLPIIEVIKSDRKPKLPEKAPLTVTGGGFQQAYEGKGILINSDRFNGLDSDTAKKRISEKLVKENTAKDTVYYKLRDWIISRQRYWGSPIPMVYCEQCGWQPVPEKELPVILPEIRDFKPTGKGDSPLAKSEKFIKAVCPKCGGRAKRETDTMDTFVCSSWYHFRYADPQNEKEFASKKNLKKWLPVDLYIGGAEHAVMHLLYSRFFCKVLYDLKFIGFQEPFLKLRHQGLILAAGGVKMSKSKGNVINPDDIVKDFGADTLRTYETFMGPFTDAIAWDTKGMIGVKRFLDKIYKFKSKIHNSSNSSLNRLVHKTIKKVTEDIQNFKFNTAISQLMILANEMDKQDQIPKNAYKVLLQLLSPFAPHLTEELWQEINQKQEIKIKDSIHSQKWLKYNPKLVLEETIQLVVQINGKVRDKIMVNAEITKKEAEDLAKTQEKVQKWLEGKEIRQIIFVPRKLINIVV
ncbi:leucine--tRNA ligase [Candidatus Parcubacteria bacterium]|nr:leucine--tRNA ligase [Candidatus Parcubacteria bacterium]